MASCASRPASRAARRNWCSAATSRSTPSSPRGSSGSKGSPPSASRSSRTPASPGLRSSPDPISWRLLAGEALMLGGMQDWPLRVMRILDHAKREHGTREIVSLCPNGEKMRTDWRGIARDARRLARVLERRGLSRGARVGTLAMNHNRPLIAWYGATGAGGILHPINPRLFDDQLAYIGNHA